MNKSASSSKNRVFIAELLELPPIKIGDFLSIKTAQTISEKHL